MFDDSRLDSSDILADFDDPNNVELRHIAGLGARIRVACDEFGERTSGSQFMTDITNSPPRGVIVVGSESRLIRAQLETVCPVPVVALPGTTLPGWLGPLDLVVILAPRRRDSEYLSVLLEANRRGASVMAVVAQGSPMIEHAPPRSCHVIETSTHDPLAAAIVTLQALYCAGLGSETSPTSLAEVADMAAEACSPLKDLSDNPAKVVASSIGDDIALVWGGSGLAARASRRIAEALRRSSGQPALAGDSETLAPIVASAEPVDVFADTLAYTRRPSLVVVPSNPEPDAIAHQREQLGQLAESRGVRITEITGTVASDEDLRNYVEALQVGLFASVYLRIGLGRRDQAFPIWMEA